MAALTITATSVAAISCVTTQGTAGATITAGQVLYLDAATGTYKLADADGAAALRVPVGIALNGAASGQPVLVATSGSITIGATLTGGIAYYLSPTAGGISPVADIITGCYPTILGIATSATVLQLQILQSGFLLP